MFSSVYNLVNKKFYSVKNQLNKEPVPSKIPHCLAFMIFKHSKAKNIIFIQ